MKQYNYSQALYLSFYSAPFYLDVGRHWKGTGFLYLLLLLALVWIPEMVGIHTHIASAIDAHGHTVAAQIPAITISDGEVSTDVETPYFISDPETEKVWAIIDLTGEYTSLEGTEAQVLLTRNAVLVRQDRGSIRETRSHDLSEVDSFTLSGEDVGRWLEVAKSWLVIVLYPFAVVFSFIYRVIQALIYAALGLLIARSLKVNLTYETLLRLTVLALTPVIILLAIRSVASVSIPALWLVAFAVAMGYLIFAIKANAVPAEPTQPTPEPIT
jgi:hypothetical protein